MGSFNPKSKIFAVRAFALRCDLLQAAGLRYRLHVTLPLTHAYSALRKRWSR